MILSGKPIPSTADTSPPVIRNRPASPAAAADPGRAVPTGVRPSGGAVATGASAHTADSSVNPASVPEIASGIASEPCPTGVVATCDPQRGDPPNAEHRTDGRDPRGRFAKGTTVGLATRRHGSEPKHGVRRFQEGGVVTPDLAAQQAEDIAGFIADLGGPENLTTAKRTIVEKAAETLTVSRLFAQDIGARGAFTARGRVRATTTGYLATVDRIVRLLGLLGLERRARPVMDLDHYLRERYGNGAGGPQDRRDAAADAVVVHNAERGVGGQADGTTGTPETER